jgi:hypothetical protein
MARSTNLKSPICRVQQYTEFHHARAGDVRSCDLLALVAATPESVLRVSAGRVSDAIDGYLAKRFKWTS